MVPDTVPEAEDTAVNKTGKSPGLKDLHSGEVQRRPRDRKENKGLNSRACPMERRTTEKYKRTRT